MIRMHLVFIRCAATVDLLTSVHAFALFPTLGKLYVDGLRGERLQ